MSDDMGLGDVSPWLSLGPGWLFTALAVVMVLTDRLVTKKRHLEAIELRDRQNAQLVEDRDTWRKAYELSQRNYETLADKQDTSVELGKTTVAIVSAMRDQRG